jgi:threonine dehydrogenase-like Zn-dependent dehydrogenase
VALINARRLPLAPIVTHSFPADQVLQAVATAADPARSVKVRITFD